MKNIVLGILGLVIVNFTTAQVIPPIHCTSAIDICDSIEIQDTLKVAIDTTADEIGPTSCLTFGEIRGTWYTFGVNDTGNFRFVITPFDTLADFDWALFRVDWGNCTDIFSVPEYEVSCDVSGIGGGYYTTGASGLLQQGHQPAVHLTSPALFYLYITTSIGDTDAVLGYTIDFSSSDMDLVACNEIGIEEEKMHSLKVYPNPAIDVAFIHLEDLHFIPSGYQLINLSGMVVQMQNNWSPAQGLNVSSLSSGIYFYRLYNDKGELLTGKIVVKD